MWDCYYQLTPANAQTGIQLTVAFLKNQIKVPGKFPEIWFGNTSRAEVEKEFANILFYCYSI